MQRRPQPCTRSCRARPVVRVKTNSAVAATTVAVAWVAAETPTSPTLSHEHYSCKSASEAKTPEASRHRNIVTTKNHLRHANARARVFHEPTNTGKLLYWYNTTHNKHNHQQRVFAFSIARYSPPPPPAARLPFDPPSRSGADSVALLKYCSRLL